MRFIINQIRLLTYWDTATRLSLFMAMGLIVVMLILLSVGPQNLRTPAAIGLVGLVISTQVIVMWGNRFLLNPTTAVNNMLVNGQYDKARRFLNNLIQQSSANTIPLRLLLAEVCINQGDMEAAHAELQAILRVDDTHVRARQMLKEISSSP